MSGWGSRELARSRAGGRCTAQLAAWVLSVADRSLRSVYGDNYSVRCLQASECIRETLSLLGIRCDVLKGALCVATIYPGSPARFSWSGFWGEDHHVWVATEFAEFIDLTISQLHLHPVRAGDALPIPALWWYPVDRWPPVFRYLHDAPIKIQLPAEEMLELERIRAKGRHLFEAEFHLPQPPPPTVAPIVMGIESLKSLDRAGWGWARACGMLLSDLPPRPDWIVNREGELMRGFQERHAKD